MLHTAMDRDVCHLRTLHRCDIRNTFRVVTVSTVYRYTSDIDIMPVIQNVPDRSRNTSTTDSSTDISANFSSYSGNYNLPTFNLELLRK